MKIDLPALKSAVDAYARAERVTFDAVIGRENLPRTTWYRLLSGTAARRTRTIEALARLLPVVAPGCSLRLKFGGAFVTIDPEGADK